MDLEDHTPSGYVNRWDLVNGEPRCPLDPIPDTDPGSAAAHAKNERIRAVLAARDAYDAAVRLIARCGDNLPSETIQSTNTEGNAVEIENPAYVAYAQAQAVVDGVDAVTLALGVISNGDPGASESGEDNAEHAAYVAALSVVSNAINPKEAE